MGFFQVDRNVFSSSVWIGGTAEERVLWIWLLGNCDDDGVVRHREIAIADGAKLSRAAVDAGLAMFSEPDPDSRTRDNDGRKIARTEEGFVRILNHELYYSKDYSTPRWRKWRDRQRCANDTNVGANGTNGLSTKDKDKDKDKKKEGDMSASKSPTPRSPSKRFWWDPERKRVWGTDEARAELKAKWLGRDLTLEEFQAQLGACDRWLEDRPEKRREGSNLANRINNWLNTYMTREQEKATK